MATLSHRLWPGVFVGALLLHAALATPFDAARMQRAAESMGVRAARTVPDLQAMLAQAALTDEPARLSRVNEFFNRAILYGDDTHAWGEIDYWASPLESMNRGLGDCEDYAIAKYFSLVAAGIPVHRMRLVYARIQMGTLSQAHMVLAYYERPDAEPLILDNLVTTVYPASRRTDLTPVFSFNTEGLWSGVGAQSAGDPQARLSRWRNVVAKATGEGFGERRPAT